MSTKIKPLLRKRAVGILILCTLLTLLAGILHPFQTNAATDRFYNHSITSYSWSQLKPNIDKWLKQGIPYASPCSGLINWKAETAYGLDCSGFVNTMVHLYYEDGSISYNWPNWFASTTWAPYLTNAGLRVCSGSDKYTFNHAYKKGKIQPGDIVVFSNGYCRGVHVAIVYGKDRYGNVLLVHEYGNHLQTTTFNNVHTWDFGAGTYSYYEVFAGTPRTKYVSQSKKSVSKDVSVNKTKLSKKGKTVSLTKKKAKHTRTAYKLTSVPKKIKKYVTLSKKGKINIKKGIPKGDWKIQCKTATMITKTKQLKQQIVITNLKLHIK